MRHVIKLENKTEILFHIGGLILIILVNLLFFEHSKMISILGDEFGYWLGAAYFLGYDWSQMASLTSYYSFGYSLLLVPFLFFCNNSITMYKCAIILNIILLLGIYELIRFSCKNLNQNLKKIDISIIALLICLYPSTLLQVQNSMPEILIIFLYWSLFVLIIKILDRPKNIYILLYELILMYLYIVHQRTIGICFAGSLFILFVIFKKTKKIKVCLLIVFVFSFNFVIFNILKENYQTSFWDMSLRTQTLLNKNDYAGQFSKLKFIFTYDGFIIFLRNMIGKLYYASTSTFLLLPIGSYYCFKKIINYFKYKILSDNTMIYIYALFAYIFMLGISCITISDYHGRLDLLTYGRYQECVFGGLILISLLYLFSMEKFSGRSCCIFIIVQIILTLCVNNWLNYNDSAANMFINTTAISDFYLVSSKPENYILAASSRAILIITIFYSVKNYISSKKKYVWLITLISVVWIVIYGTVMKFGFLNWRIPETNQNIEIVNNIKKNNFNDKIYYFTSENMSPAGMYIQFLLPKKIIYCINTVEEFESIEEKSVIITAKNNSVDLELDSKEYLKVQESSQLQLWVPKN